MWPQIKPINLLMASKTDYPPFTEYNQIYISICRLALVKINYISGQIDDGFF